MSQLPTVPGDHCAVRKTASDYQKDFRQKVEGKTCDCGKPAFRFKVTGFICKRCDAIEIEQAFQYASYESRIKPIAELCEKVRRKFRRKSNSELMAENDRGESGFCASINESPGEIIVTGHGCYRLVIERMAA